MYPPKHKKVKMLRAGDIIVGSAGTQIMVIDTAYATLKTGFFTVLTEFGPLILEPEQDQEIL